MLKLGFWENFKKLPFETKIFVAVLPLGIILRLVALFARDIWFDEAFTYQIAKLPLKDLLRAILTDNNPPIYYLLIHFVLYLGKSIFLLRTPSLILNLLSVYVLYKMVKTNFNKKIKTILDILFHSFFYSRSLYTVLHRPSNAAFQHSSNFQKNKYILKEVAFNYISSSSGSYSLADFIFSNTTQRLRLFEYIACIAGNFSFTDNCRHRRRVFTVISTTTSVIIYIFYFHIYNRYFIFP